MASKVNSLVDEVVDDLQAEARTEGIEIDSSLGAELENYSKHEGVHDLGEQDLRLVLKGIGLRALRHPQVVEGKNRRRVGAGAVRLAISNLCPPMEPCSGAARALIKKELVNDAG